jgi:hypothetical protein
LLVEVVFVFGVVVLLLMMEVVVGVVEVGDVIGLDNNDC